MKRFWLIAAVGVLIASGSGQAVAQINAQTKIKREGAAATANSDRMKNLNLQKQMGQQSKTETTISNTSKKSSETASGVTRKLGF